MADILSAPTTITFLYLPDSINTVPVAKAFKKPEQAAAKSNEAVSRMPTALQIKLDAEGKK